MRWLQRLSNLRAAKGSVYRQRGHLVLNSTHLASEDWVEIPEARPSGSLTAPIRLAGSARPGTLLAYFRHLQDANQNERPEDWLDHVKPLWKEV